MRGAEAGCACTLGDVARVLGVSRQRAQQIESGALLKCRRWCACAAFGSRSCWPATFGGSRKRRPTCPTLPRLRELAGPARDRSPRLPRRDLVVTQETEGLAKGAQAVDFWLPGVDSNHGPSD